MLRTITYGVNGAVLAGVIAAPVLWASVDKTVRLDVDGHVRTVHTTAARVGQVLDAAGYRVTSHDLVAPNSSAAVADGTRIVVRHGRLLNLDVDGKQLAVWTTAATVNEALDALGYPTSDFVSVSRSRRLSPLGSTSIAIRTPRTVSVVHDGRSDTVTTTDLTVGDVLADLAITVGPQDRMSVPASAAVVAGQVIRLQRVETRTETSTHRLPYRVQQVKDAALDKGTRLMVRAGRNGTAKSVYAVVYVDGSPTGRTLVRTETLRAPVSRLVKIGTRKVLVATAAPSSGNGSGSGSSGSGSSGSGSSGSGSSGSGSVPTSGSAQEIARALLAARGWGSDQFSCLVTLWNHESGWRVHAANPSGAYGIPQALPGSKMASAGPDWQNNAETQIRWGLGYIAARYGTPCGAWSTWQAHGGWY